MRTFRTRLLEHAQSIGAEADEISLQLREARERIAHLEKVIAFAFDALESNNEAEAFLIIKNANLRN